MLKNHFHFLLDCILSLTVYLLFGVVSFGGEVCVMPIDWLRGLTPSSNGNKLGKYNVVSSKNEIEKVNFLHLIYASIT